MGPPSLQHRAAHLLHLNLNCFCVIVKSMIVLFCESNVITATTLSIYSKHLFGENFLQGSCRAYKCLGKKTKTIIIQDYRIMSRALEVKDSG